MIKKVFKYTMQINDRVEVELPEGAEILTVQCQLDQPQLWALVDPQAQRETRVFRIAGTGHPIEYDMGSEYKYIDTFQMMNGSLVFHVFEMKGEPQ